MDGSSFGHVATVITLSTAEQIHLDLNGQTVNLQNGENLYTFVKNAGAHVVVTDTSKAAKGKVVLTGSNSSNGGITEVLYGNTLEVYRGTFDATDFTPANNGTVFAVRGPFIVGTMGFAVQRFSCVVHYPMSVILFFDGIREKRYCK